MKKLLLLTLVSLISIGAFADGKLKPKKSNLTINKDNIADPNYSPTQLPSVVSYEMNLKGTQAVERIYIGKSGNVYSVFVQDQTCLDYSSELNLTTFTYRADPDTYPDAANSGTILVTPSLDGGESWDEPIIVINTDPPYNRYPSGAIFNPEGNTQADQAYTAVVGLSHPGADFDQVYMGSTRIDGENIEYEHEDNDPSYSGFQTLRAGIQGCSDGMVHAEGRKFEDNGSGYSTELALNPWTAEFNGTGFDWSEEDVEVELAFRNDGTTKNFWTFGSAWADDGSIGYIWLIGQTEDLVDNGGYQPIVFYSNDQGSNWDEIEVLLENDNTMSTYLRGTAQNTGPVWPLCTDIAGAVDNTGALQLFVKATGTFSTHPDSIAYSYENELDYIFNIELNSEGVQNVIAVDSVLASDVPDGSEHSYAPGSGTNAVGWDAMMQVSKSPDEDAVFVVWTDTQDPAEFDGENARPDIKAAGRFITDNDFEGFASTNFTHDDLYAGFYFFIYVSPHSKIISEGGANYLHIPISTSVTPTEYTSNGYLDPVTHNYVKGVKYLWTVGLEEGQTKSKFSVAQNQPNPFNGATVISVTTEATELVMVEISNIMGQTIYTLNSTVNGAKEIELNSNNMEAGVYFYTVTVGSESITKKMIVK